MVVDLIARNRHSCRPSRPDSRDRVYQTFRQNLRESVDLREWDSRVEDQKNLGSCVGHAIAGAYELMLRRNYPNQFTELSSLFVYYNARADERLTELDAGASIRKALESVRYFGICSEELWPYDVDKFDERPSIEAYSDARHRTLENYRRLYNIEEMITAVNNNRPVVIGFSVYLQFFDLSLTNSVVELPKNRSTEYFGEHAVYIVGYNQEKQQFLCKNSFGPDWGDNGYFYMPYEYARLEVFEAWIFDIRLK